MPANTFAPAPAPPVKLLLNPREAAQALSICEKTLWSMTAPRGPVPVVRIGKAVRYDVRDLSAAIDRMKGGAE